MIAKTQRHKVPSRARPFEKTQKPTPAWLKKLLGRELAPSYEEYAAVLDALWEGDPAMDALVDWMVDYGPREARVLFDKAVSEGLATIPNCPEPLYLFIKSLERRPAWVDAELIDEGARFIHSTGMTAPYVLRNLALMGGYLLSGFNQSLVMTGALNKGASRRVAETGKWWIDCTEIGGLRRFAPGFRSTLHVRLVHSLVRRNLASREEWEASKWGMPLSQVDMVATYLGFCVVMLGGLRKMGVPVTPRESRAVMHLWKYACWVMGVDEKWLVDTERDGIVLLQHALMTQSQPDWTSQELGQALAREPLDRHFPRFEKLQRKLAYQKHLSVSRYFLDRTKMQQLGLPEGVSAWYPLATFFPRLASYGVQRYIPGLRQWQQKLGRSTQRHVLTQMFGDAEQDLIRPGADHPGHV
ncbi:MULTISPECIES: oxygenase MpaB family protein [unclassified Alcanivorax]|uniref:oxygenase MpaB family protein n=1 Tax=unclassified Alcanivorax TaxID=2638842 RepID=UPI002352571E|nr:oxygenase MpaB family protein [Alcanivorax sp. UBA3183]